MSTTPEQALVDKALQRAFSLGQTYWQQADSESYAQNRRSDDTLAKFWQHVADTLDALSQPQQPAPADDKRALSEISRRALTAEARVRELEEAAVQPPVLPLTEEEIDKIFDAHNEAPTMSYRYLVARAIEAKVRGTGSVPPSANLDSVHPAQRSTQGARTEPGDAS